MSIRVYDAYRVRRGADLWPLLWSIKRRAQEQAKIQLAKVYCDVFEGRAQALSDWYERAGLEFTTWLEGRPMDWLLHDEWMKTHPESRIGVRPSAVLPVSKSTWDIDAWARREYGAQLASPERNWWNLDVSVRVYRHNSQFALRGIVDRMSLVGESLNIMGFQPELELFSYWNDSDRPEGVSAEKWSQRAKWWAQINARADEFITLDIVSFADFDQVSPLRELLAEYEDQR